MRPASTVTVSAPPRKTPYLNTLRQPLTESVGNTRRFRVFFNKVYLKNLRRTLRHTETGKRSPGLCTNTAPIFCARIYTDIKVFLCIALISLINDLISIMGCILIHHGDYSSLFASCLCLAELMHIHMQLICMCLCCLKSSTKASKCMICASFPFVLMDRLR